MIISRTPFRISLFGGGTDYPIWYRENGGAVLGTTIDKYCYITCRYLPPFFSHKHRIVYSNTELVSNIEHINHPSVRESIRFMNIQKGLEIHHDGDLPARSGLGSSSAFTVGLLHSLYALQGKMPTKMQLATEAIHIEQEMIKENVGSQDQIFAAFGGFNHLEFMANDQFTINRVIIPSERLRLLEDHLLLFYTGLSREASAIAKEQIKQTPNKEKELNEMHRLVDEAINILVNHDSLISFGQLLHENWLIKRSLTNKISNDVIDNIYAVARKTGAIGGKLLGAGGGGFILLFTKPENKPAIINKLQHLLHVDFKFENKGSQIIFYEPEE